MRETVSSFGLTIIDAQAQLARLVDKASTTHERFDITRNGTRAAVLLGADDYDAMMETVAILSDATLVKEIDKSTEDLVRGDTFTADAVRAAMRQRPTEPMKRAALSPRYTTESEELPIVKAAVERVTLSPRPLFWCWHRQCTVQEVPRPCRRYFLLDLGRGVHHHPHARPRAWTARPLSPPFRGLCARSTHGPAQLPG